MNQKIPEAEDQALMRQTRLNLSYLITKGIKDRFKALTESSKVYNPFRSN